MDIQPHNLAALLLGTAEFRFSDGALTPAAAAIAGFKDFGNLTASTLQPKSTAKPHKGSYRGIKRTDKNRIIDLESGFQLKGDEIDAYKAKYFFFGSPGADYTQSVRAAVVADAIPAPAKDLFYPLMIGGVRVRKLTTVAVVSSAPTLVENVDYVVDYELGYIRFITTPGTITSITLTAPAIASGGAGSLKTITPLTTSRRFGIGQLNIWNDDGSLFAHMHGFGCDVTPEGNPAIGDNDTDFTLNVLITNPVGTVEFAN